MHYLAGVGLIDRSRIMDGLRHPSGANAKCIAYFLGNKAGRTGLCAAEIRKLDAQSGVTY